MEPPSPASLARPIPTAKQGLTVPQKQCEEFHVGRIPLSARSERRKIPTKRACLQGLCWPCIELVGKMRHQSDCSAAANSMGFTLSLMASFLMVVLVSLRDQVSSGLSLSETSF